MNVEIGTEAVLFPEKEYKNGIFFAVQGAGTMQYFWSIGCLKSNDTLTI